jgi:hypothetical protein
MEPEGSLPHSQVPANCLHFFNLCVTDVMCKLYITVCCPVVIIHTVGFCRESFAFCPRGAFVCIFLLFAITIVISVCGCNWLVSVTKTHCVLCELRYWIYIYVYIYIYTEDRYELQKRDFLRISDDWTRMYVRVYMYIFVCVCVCVGARACVCLHTDVCMCVCVCICQWFWL